MLRPDCDLACFVSHTMPAVLHLGVAFADYLHADDDKLVAG
jgi:hypothetical protein